MSSAIVSSDWHADAFTSGVSRYADVAVAAFEVVEAAIREEVDLFLFLGDLSDPDNVRSHRASALACECAAKLNAKGIPSLWLTGNHDIVEDGQGTHTLSPLKAAQLAHVTVIDEPCVVRDSHLGIVYIGLPFTSRTSAYDAAKVVERAREFYDTGAGDEKVIIMGHLTIPGIHPGSESTTMARGRDFMFPVDAVAEHFPDALVMNGHYHRAQSFMTSRGFLIEIPGALERLRHDEEDHVPSLMKVVW